MRNKKLYISKIIYYKGYKSTCNTYSIFQTGKFKQFITPIFKLLHFLRILLLFLTYHLEGIYTKKNRQKLFLFDNITISLDTL